MRVVMTLLVRDEEDILETHIEHHLASGVDFIVATDNLSVDGSNKILRRYAQDGVLFLIEENGDDYRQAEWVTRMARLAAARFGADWVINSDADELWMPVGGDIREAISAAPPGTNHLIVSRSNFVSVRAEGGRFYERMNVREVTSLNDLGHPLPPKICHRATPDVSVVQGNHALVSQTAHDTFETDRLWIAHFPMRSWSQFENKIVKGGAAVSRNASLAPGVSGTWKHLYQLHCAGRLREHYESRSCTSEDLERGIEAGTLVHDPRVGAQLRSLEPVIVGR